MPRPRAPQQITEPPAVQVRIVGSREIVRCPSKSFAPAHWIPEHAIEECHPDARARLTAFDGLAELTLKRVLAGIHRSFALAREREIRRIRNEYNTEVIP